MSSRQQYEQRPEVRLKRHLKNIDEGYIKKRKLYSEKPEVKDRRKSLNTRRRVLCSNLITLLKTGKLCLQTDPEKPHRKLQNKRGRLVSDNLVINCAKNGLIQELKFEKETDLEEDKYDQLPIIQSDIEYQDLLEDYEEWCELTKNELTNKENLKEFLSSRNDRTGKLATGTEDRSGGNEESE